MPLVRLDEVRHHNLSATLRSKHVRCCHARLVTSLLTRRNSSVRRLLQRVKHSAVWYVCCSWLTSRAHLLVVLTSATSCCTISRQHLPLIPLVNSQQSGGEAYTVHS